MQEPVGSDFSSGATLANTADHQNGFVAAQSTGCDRPSNIDGPIEGTSSVFDNTLEKAEELSSGILNEFLSVFFLYMYFDECFWDFIAGVHQA